MQAALPCLQAKEGLTPTSALDAPAAAGVEAAFSRTPVPGPAATAVAPAVPATATQGTQTLADPVPSSPEPAQQTKAGSTAAVREAADEAIIRTADAEQQTEPAGAAADSSVAYIAEASQTEPVGSNVGASIARTAETAQQTEPAGGAAVGAAASPAEAAQAAEKLAQSMDDLQEDLSSVHVGFRSLMHCKAQHKAIPTVPAPLLAGSARAPYSSQHLRQRGKY